jgi:hypothetical protein
MRLALSWASRNFETVFYSALFHQIDTLPGLREFKMHPYSWQKMCYVSDVAMFPAVEFLFLSLLDRVPSHDEDVDCRIGDVRVARQLVAVIQVPENVSQIPSSGITAVR